MLEHSPEDPRTFDAAYSLTGEILGRGGYGVVFKVTRRVDGEIFAWGGSARSGFLDDLHILRLFHNDTRATSGEPAHHPGAALLDVGCACLDRRSAPVLERIVDDSAAPSHSCSITNFF